MPAAAIRQIAVFGCVGIAATATHFVIGLGLVWGAGISPFVANIPAFLTAFLVSYFGHHRLSFQSDAAHRTALPKFLAIALLGLAHNQLIVLIIVNFLDLGYPLALVLIATLVPAVTYVLSKYWAFAKGPA